MKKALLTLFLFFLVIVSFADEGMWIPMLLKKYKFEDMQKKGFRLTAEDIYSINQASMKDAIVLFGRGCTGELVSDEGLILTNHHCGYSFIQSHSTIEHDYLTDGFWAMNRSEELSNPRLTVTFLVRMDDVTSRVLNGVTDQMTELERNSEIQKNIKKIKNEESDDNKYAIDIKPFYYGNEFYMFIYEIFRDVRLVGAPPSAIGKFGGDTDNWMWPRHTGDFSVFRIYADKDNKPAVYSPENVPYKPKRFFPVSIKGIKKDDFTMVYGFPGHTQEYLPSYGVQLLVDVENPPQIKLREARLDIMKSDIEVSKLVRIQYSSKYATVANYWKKWIGENRGLKRLNAVEKKQEFEKGFQAWADANSNIYKDVLPKYKSIYEKLTPLTKIEAYLYEGIMAIEMVRFSGNFRDAEIWLSSNDSTLNITLEKYKQSAKGFYKDFNLPTDKKIFAKMLKMYEENISPENFPDLFKEWQKKYNGNWSACAEEICEKTVFSSQTKIDFALNNFRKKGYKAIINDPVFKLWKSYADLFNEKIYPYQLSYNSELDSLHRIFMKGQMEYQKDRIFYPDANLTLRVTYGKVADYYPRDAVRYDWYTTLDGIIEKDDSTIYDYDVPSRLKDLWKNKDFGDYGEQGVMNVCFIGSNHTTGGNSGSPVLNGNGELIGINFDRDWEGTMSDIMYDPDQCRNITLDIRYVLFIIDKFAGAGHLLKEMKIVK